MLFDKALPYRDVFQDKPAIAFATGEGGQSKSIQSIEEILEFFGVRFVQRSDILSAGLAVQGRPDDSALEQAKAAGRKLGDAGVKFVCGLRSKDVITG
jgi:NAD(P)H dehydrogenase (quinone)